MGILYQTKCCLITMEFENIESDYSYGLSDQYFVVYDTSVYGNWERFQVEAYK